MRIELLPILLGIVAVVMGAILMLDAAIEDGTFTPVERRQSQRPPRSRTGEGLVGAAIIFLGASLIGRDQWPYTTLSVVLAVVLGAGGVVLNWRYLREMAVASKRRGSDPGAPATAHRLDSDDGDLSRSDERPAPLS